MSIVKFRHYPAKSFNNLMDDFFPQLPSLFLNEPVANLGQIVPVNIKQDENGYVLDVIAPGFNKEDFKIHLEKNLLTISAEKQAEEEKKNEKDMYQKLKYALDNPKKMLSMANKLQHYIKFWYEREMYWKILLEEYNKLIFKYF